MVRLTPHLPVKKYNREWWRSLISLLFNLHLRKTGLNDGREHRRRVNSEIALRITVFASSYVMLQIGSFNKANFCSLPLNNHSCLLGPAIALFRMQISARIPWRFLYGSNAHTLHVSTHCLYPEYSKCTIDINWKVHQVICPLLWVRRNGRGEDTVFFSLGDFSIFWMLTNTMDSACQWYRHFFM